MKVEIYSRDDRAKSDSQPEGPEISNHMHTSGS